MSSNRSDFDIVLWGATGFAGRLVAEYLAERYEPSELTWAIAGRNREKLQELREEIAEHEPVWEELPIRTGDAFDRESLERLARDAEVVCSTVGPYAKYGTDLVAACVKHGTDYCDLTGEVHWIREIIDTYRDDARLHGARIVHCCGFDSIPSDLGTLMVQDRAKREYGVSCDDVAGFVLDATSSFSGGTLASMGNAFEEASNDPAVRRVATDPYGLNPAGEREGPDEGMQQGPRWDDALGGWTAPFLMATVNEKVVRRSNALLGYRWGRNFRYREALAAGSGPLGAVRAAGMAAATGLFVGGMAVGPIRRLLESTVLPAPGEGPSRETIESGSFEVKIVGRGTDPEGDEFEIEGTVAADRDPGYGATAKMLGEAAVCLASGESDSPLGAGILTPASGLGMPLVERLRDTGMVFAVD